MESLRLRNHDSKTARRESSSAPPDSFCRRHGRLPENRIRADPPKPASKAMLRRMEKRRASGFVHFIRLKLYSYLHRPYVAPPLPHGTSTARQ
uniref:hypothetical protein n=1 Tax=Edaphosphingomonas laterariae TaxID=861865 RepID=UPI001C52FD97|nr:hypothetical protein [Sphingomonas laterariae]